MSCKRIAGGHGIQRARCSPRSASTVTEYEPRKRSRTLRMIDGGEADDKIIAVLENDETYTDTQELADVPKGTIDRIHHYFITYKQVPGAKTQPKVEVSKLYNRKTAYEVIKQSMRDYAEIFG